MHSSHKYNTLFYKTLYKIQYWFHEKLIKKLDFEFKKEKKKLFTLKLVYPRAERILSLALKE